MPATTESVGTNAYTILSSVKRTPPYALQCIIHVARMSMDNALMTTRAIAILNVERDVFGTVPGQSITTYLVGMSACTGKYLQ